jgi:pimeloyl-ACP methyl ester carboxylesterase
MALGRVAATATASYIEADYHFQVMEGYSHWLLEEAPDEIGALVLDRLRHNSVTGLQ